MSDPIALVEAARAHVRDVVNPSIDGWQQRDRFPREAVADAARSGLTGLYAPTERGGQALSPGQAAPVFEELGRGDGMYGFTLSMHNLVTMATSMAVVDTSAGQWTERLAAGKALGSFLVTEHAGGSDPIGAMTTRASADGDGWVLNGAKAWASLAGDADVYAVVCRSGEAESGIKDMMMVLVAADDPGVRVTRIYDKSTARFLPIGDLEFSDVRLDVGRVIAPAGQGFQLAMAAIDIARLNIAAGAVGLAVTALQIAVQDAASRRLFGSRVLDLQANQFALADVETSIQAGRLLYRRAGELTGQPGGTVAIAHAKRFCPDAAVEAAITCTRVMGANGSLTTHPMPRLLALAQLLTMVDGASGVQRLLIGRELARRVDA
ncbi:MAG: acyl-CoA dehydrogenase family protein [Solirubrobacteraceae bacterium]